MSSSEPKKGSALPERPIEGEDYYVDPSGLLVFTREYHLKRGSCCGSGCRHCPYDHVAVPEWKRKKSQSKQ